ncbi:hypothetical protein R1flu_013101 [Riccia fluitans]|uniref:Uncharacterized protein n=1 Tax=Riccia fluitans TaxID=41844 RepID=A0ABD1ZEY6_9MARC
MAPRSHKNLKVKTKEVKIPHLTNANKKKMEAWGLGVLAPVRPKHFHHNQLALYHYAWVAIKDPTAPTPDWEDAIEKTMSRQIKVLGVYNEATCLGPYLAHLYSHFHEMDNKEKDDSKTRKALEQTISDSKTKMEDEKEPKEEFPHAVWIGEASKSKPLDKKMTVDLNEWGVHLQNGKPQNFLRHCTWRLAM